jgi:hypothetical protein
MAAFVVNVMNFQIPYKGLRNFTDISIIIFRSRTLFDRR